MSQSKSVISKIPSRKLLANLSQELLAYLFDFVVIFLSEQVSSLPSEVANSH